MALSLFYAEGSTFATAKKLKSNTFPRSEGAKSDPRSIDTLRASFPAVSMLESCDFADEKCGCFRGPKTDVHFAEKY